MLAFILLSPAAVVQAKPNRTEQIYQIEILLFKNLTPSQTLDEIWPEWHPLTLPKDGILLPEAQAGRREIKPYSKLSVDQLNLSPLAHRLKNSANFKPLLHLGWRQRALPEKKGLPIIFYPDGQAPEERKLAGNFAVSSPSNMEITGNPGCSYINAETDSGYPEKCRSISQPIAANKLLPDRPQNSLEFIGTAHFYRTRVLRASVNIQLNQLPNDSPSGELIGFVMQETRGIRPGQIHYFDHPKFGLLLEVTKVKMQAPTTDSNQKIQETNIP